MLISLSALSLGTTAQAAPAPGDDFAYTNEQFADIQMLRYKVEVSTDSRFVRKRSSTTSPKPRSPVVTFSTIKTADTIFVSATCLKPSIVTIAATASPKDFQAFVTYVKRFWFSSGLHHHYGNEKFVPGFSEQWLRTTLRSLNYTLDEAIYPVLFDPT